MSRRGAAMLDTVEIVVGRAPRRSIIWLHGLGADGHDFAPIVEQLELAEAMRFVFPHAPVRPVTVNGGMPMRAWFDIFAIRAGAPEDEAGIRASAAAVTDLLDREIDRGICAENVIVAGFSQGGAMALHVGLREPRKLAGILALSAYLPLARTLAGEKSSANAGISLFMAHGDADPTVPIALGQASRRILLAEGYRPQWHVYAMGHAVCAEEISDISRWLDGLWSRPSAAPLPSPPSAPS